MRESYSEGLQNDLKKRSVSAKAHPSVEKPKYHYERLYNIVHRIGPVMVKDRGSRALSAVHRAIMSGLPLEYRRLGQSWMLLYLSGQEVAAQRYAVLSGLAAKNKNNLTRTYLARCRHLARAALKEHHIDRRAAL